MLQCVAVCCSDLGDLSLTRRSPSLTSACKLSRYDEISRPKEVICAHKVTVEQVAIIKDPDIDCHIGMRVSVRAQIDFTEMSEIELN